jgi:hypothetical protein
VAGATRVGVVGEGAGLRVVGLDGGMVVSGRLGWEH